MKSIRIKIDKPKIPEGLNLKHVSTSYRISRDPDMRDESKVLFEVIEDSINLYEIIIDANILPNETVYCSTRYHYLDNSVNYQSKWSMPSPINSNRHGITYPDTILKTPNVRHTIDEDGVFSIEISPMEIFTGIGDHTLTSWYIEDSNGKPVYIRKDDKDNKLKLYPSVELDNNKAYIIKASQTVTGNSDSNYGKEIFISGVKTRGLYEFEVFTKFYINTNVWHRLKIYVPNFKNYDLEIRRPNGDVVVKLYECPILVHYINTFGFEYNNTYEWWVRVRFQDDSVTDFKKEWEGVALLKENADDLEDPNIGFLGKITDGPSFNIESESNDNTSINSYEIMSKEFFYYINNKIVLLKWEGDSIIYVKDLLDLRTLNTIDPEEDIDVLVVPYISFIKHSDYELLIHYRVNNNNNQFGKSVLLYCGYNPLTKELELIDRKDVSNKVNFVGLANNIMRVSKNMYYGLYESDATIKPIREGIWLERIEVTEVGISLKTYIAKKRGIYSYARLFTSKNKDLYLISGTDTVKTNITNSDLVYYRTNNNILRININRLQEDKDGIYDNLPSTFDVTKKSINIPTDMSPLEVYDFSPVSLGNGETLFFNNCNSGRYKESQDLLVYNSLSGMFRVEKYKLNMKVPFRNIVRFKNWDILRISSNVESKQATYVYLSVQNNPNDYKDSVAKLSYPKMLSFKDNKTNIENPYHFDSPDIGINPPFGKVLRWLDKRRYKTYTFSNVIFSRSKIGSNNPDGLPIDFVKGITLLNNVELMVGLGQIIGENTYQVGHGANPAPYAPYIKVIGENLTTPRDRPLKINLDHNLAEVDYELTPEATQYVSIEVPDPEIDNKYITVRPKNVPGTAQVKLQGLGVDGEVYATTTFTINIT